MAHLLKSILISFGINIVIFLFFFGALNFFLTPDSIQGLLNLANVASGDDLPPRVEALKQFWCIITLYLIAVVELLYLVWAVPVTRGADRGLSDFAHRRRFYWAFLIMLAAIACGITGFFVMVYDNEHYADNFVTTWFVNFGVYCGAAGALLFWLQTIFATPFNTRSGPPLGLTLAPWTWP